MRYKKFEIPTIGFTVFLFIFHAIPWRAVAQPAPSQNQAVRFTNVTAELGIQFRHTNGESGQKYFIEPIGSGVALLDFDNDGDLDLYLVNGSDLPGLTSPMPPTNRLYRNDSGIFTDVTVEASVGDTGYGLGGAASAITTTTVSPISM